MEVFGKSVAADTAVASKAPLPVKEDQMEVEKRKKSVTGDGKKNGIKEKETDGVVTNVTNHIASVLSIVATKVLNELGNL